MHNQRRAERQVEIFEEILKQMQARGRKPSYETIALLVVAARLEALEDMLSVALPTAGEGV